MEQQKQIMESSGHQTDQLIEAADIQALASRRIASASRREAHTADRNAEAAAAFAASAEGINQQTKDAIADWQRPYVYVLPYPPTTTFEAEKKRLSQEWATQHNLTFNISVYNGGASVATVNVTRPRVYVGADAFMVAKRDCSPQPTIEKHILIPTPAVPIGLTDISPSKGMHSVSTGQLTETQIRHIIEGKERIVVFDDLKYTGPRGGDFWTKYCFEFNSSGNFGPCFGYCEEMH